MEERELVRQCYTFAERTEDATLRFLVVGPFARGSVIRGIRFAANGATNTVSEFGFTVSGASRAGRAEYVSGTPLLTGGLVPRTRVDGVANISYRVSTIAAQAWEFPLGYLVMDGSQYVHMAWTPGSGLEVFMYAAVWGAFPTCPIEKVLQQLMASGSLRVR